MDPVDHGFRRVLQVVIPGRRAAEDIQLLTTNTGTSVEMVN
jgi:hypothetical protein